MGRRRTLAWLGVAGFTLYCAAPRPEPEAPRATTAAPAGPASTTRTEVGATTGVPAVPIAKTSASGARTAPSASEPAAKPRPKRASLPASESCKKLARVYCANLERCVPIYVTEELGDEDDCVDRFGGWCTRAETLPGSGFSADAVLGCTKGLETQTCGTLRPLEDLPIPACHPLGKLAKGAACLDDAQCGSGFCSRDPRLGVPACGICAPRARSNGKCWNLVPGSPRQGCPVGEVCSRGFCLGPMRNEGEPCGAASPWTSNCYGDAPLEPWPDSGLACVPPAPDAKWMGTCRIPERAMLHRDVVLPGEPCDEEHDRCLGGRCENAICTPNPAAGDPCGDETECSFPFVCVKGKCALTDPACGG